MIVARTVNSLRSYAFLVSPTHYQRKPDLKIPSLLTVENSFTLRSNELFRDFHQKNYANLPKCAIKFDWPGRGYTYLSAQFRTSYIAKVIQGEFLL